MRRYLWDVFFAHSSKDKTIVRRIANELEEEGLKTWLDEEQIQPGDTTSSIIEEGLDRSQRIIVCLSPTISESRWVRAEYSSFLDEELSGELRSKIIPLIIKNIKTSDIPKALREILKFNYSDTNDRRKLIELLKSTSVDRDLMEGVEYTDPTSLFYRFMVMQVPTIATDIIQELSASFKKIYFDDKIIIEDELDKALRRLL